MSADSLGRDGFVTRHNLWSAAQVAAAAEVSQRVRTGDLEVIRLSFADQHGILRGKSVVAEDLVQVFRSGCTITTTLLAKDTSHRTVYPVWSRDGGLGMVEMSGGGDVVMVPDPHTFRVLPWAQRCGWILCDLYFQDGRAVPFSTRALCRDVMQRLAQRGYDYLSGLEIEFHLLRLEDPRLAPADATQPGTPPQVSLLTQGFQYLTETRLDELEPVTDLLRSHLRALDLPLRTIEVEFGPSQVELTFHPCPGIGTADNAVLLRSAVKQICRREGLHATFMCRPQLENLFSSGWHLHQSLVARDSGANAFTPEHGTELLSPLGRRFVAGLLAHAPAACALTTPTLNGYKRYKPFSLAPDRVVWARDNRGAMLRAIGGPGDDATRIENRVGDPAANPYLYLAAQVISGLAGIAADAEPPPAAVTPYETDAPRLPGSLMQALAALRDDTTFRAGLGETFVRYFEGIKEAEITRFLSEVTDWEQREYFDAF